MMECFLEDIERGKLIYNYKPQFMGNRNFEVSGGEEIMRETIRKVAGPICLIIMIIEIVCGIMDSSMQAFIVAFLAGLMGVLYITDTKKEK